MEYSAHYDFFITFQGISNGKGDLVQYRLTNVSDNFGRISDVEPSDIVGKSMSELIDEFQDVDDILCFKDIYNHIGPNVIRKFEKYLASSDRWYLVNIFGQEKNLLILYTDITVIKKYLVNTSELIGNDTISVCYTDGLTGLYTKDYFKVELSRLDTERQFPLSVIVGDLNGLKLINDAFGYHMGDEAIKTTADILKKSFRREEIISRFGGDEFVILLPKTSRKQAVERIEEVNKKFNSLNFDFIELSMSFGSSTKTNIKENIIDILKSAEEEMYFNKLQESKKMKKKIVRGLKDRLMATTTETEEHHNRLKELALMLGQAVGISESEREELSLLCEFHDIGTISIPNHIYNKQEELNKEDWHTIKRHCEIGYHIMKSVAYDKPIAEHILMHHERWDGKGYPRLLKGEEIPLVVRIFTIVDSYEAMVNNRPNREKLSPDQAIEEIMRNSGTQFDPYLANVFVSLMTKDSKSQAL